MGLSWADDAGDPVREAAALTDRPFAGNFVLNLRSAPSSRSGTFRRSADRVVHLGRSHSYVDSVHDAGGLVMHTVGSAEEARRAAGCGVDIIVAQGWERK